VRFEARELKPYAEPVSSTDLREGEVYFSVQFADEKLLVPIVEPLVFVGRNLGEDDTNLLYFQNFESYTVGGRYASVTEENIADFKVRDPEEIKHIFEYERALDALMSCSLRRRGHSRF
jgi:hypothetical protein